MKKQILIVFISFLLTGCYNYKDIDGVIFATDTIIDKRDNDNIIVYVRAFKGVKALKETEVTGEIIYFKTEGRTVFDAIRSLTLESNEKINFSQNKMIIFSKKVAQEGIDKYFDMVVRGQEYNLRTMIVIFKGNVEELVGLTLKEENNLGMYLWEVQRNSQKQSGKINISYLNKFLNNRYGVSQINIIPEIKIHTVIDRKRLMINNSSIIKGWKEISEISNEKVMWNNFLTDNIHSTVIIVKDDIARDNYITFEVLNNKTKTNTEYKNGIFKMRKHIHTTLVLGETQREIKLDENNLAKMKKEAEEHIKMKCMELFNEYRNKKIDIFDAKVIFEREYGKKPDDELLENTEMSVNVTVNIEGSFDYQDFLK